MCYDERREAVTELLYRDLAQGNVGIALMFNCLHSPTVSRRISKENLITSFLRCFKNFWSSQYVTFFQ